MKLEDYKTILISIGLVFALLIVSSGALVLLPHSSGEQFSELYILGSQGVAADYPYNIVPDRSYTVYVNIGNHVGSLAYYRICVKLLSVSDDLPDVALGIASQAKVLQEKRFCVLDEYVYEYPVAFSISNVSILNSQINIGSLKLNENIISLNKVVDWDSTKSEFPVKLLFELWIYNSQLNKFEFDNRFVYLELNCTS